MVEGTGLENQRWKHPQVRILSFPPKKLAPKGYFLAAVFQARMFPLVAVFVVIIAILFRNWSQFNFSCHGVIIPYMWYNG